MRWFAIAQAYRRNPKMFNERSRNYAQASKRKGGSEMTPEQIKNWRNILVSTLGPYALLMPDSEVQVMHDKMQAKIGEKEE